MAFQPSVGQQLSIDNAIYHFTVHPSAPGMPYGQQGRKATVFQLASGSERRALKVFTPRFREPRLVGIADRLAKYAALAGLTVCRRSVLTARRHGGLLREHPDLTYAVLMPWIEGPSWTEVMLSRRSLTPGQSLELARGLAEILVGLEEQGLAHGDLSGGNVLLPALAERATGHPTPVELVDVEEMYGSEMERPTDLPGGSLGYAHRGTPSGLWGPEADRFSGSILLAEMLGWCDADVRAGAWGEGYFEPQWMQMDGKAYDLLVKSLENRWGGRLATLLERAWRSDVLRDCATFSEWLVALPDTSPRPAAVAAHPAVPAVSPVTSSGRAAPPPQALPPAPVATPKGAAPSPTPYSFVPIGVEVLCPECDGRNAADEIYCQTCGFQLCEDRPCGRCAAAMPIKAHYCPQCGRRAV